MTVMKLTILGLFTVLLFGAGSGAQAGVITTICPLVNDVDTFPSPTVADCNVVTGGTITDINVELAFENTAGGSHYINNLILTLIHDAVSVVLYEGDDDIGSAVMDAIFDDAAGAAAPVSGSVIGTFQPFPDALASYNGLDALGLWQLSILDPIEDGDGTDLTKFNLIITTEMPEPGTLALFGLGLLGLGAMRRRKRAA